MQELDHFVRVPLFFGPGKSRRFDSSRVIAGKFKWVKFLPDLSAVLVTSGQEPHRMVALSDGAIRNCRRGSRRSSALLNPDSPDAAWIQVLGTIRRSDCPSPLLDLLSYVELCRGGRVPAPSPPSPTPPQPRWRSEGGGDPEASAPIRTDHALSATDVLNDLARQTAADLRISLYPGAERPSAIPSRPPPNSTGRLQVFGAAVMQLHLRHCTSCTSAQTQCTAGCGAACNLRAEIIETRACIIRCRPQVLSRRVRGRGALPGSGRTR